MLIEYQITGHENNCHSKYCLFFFASPKKNQKRRPENDVHRVFGKEHRLGFCATVLNSSGSLIGSQPATTCFFKSGLHVQI